MNYKRIILLLSLHGLFLSASFAQQPLLPKSKHGLVIIAHRGSHVNYPENSIASIEDAIRLGADYVELDVRTSKDGHLLLNHNETVDARTNGKGKVADLTWTELQQLQLNSNDGKIHRIPSLAEALRVCKNRINIYLDFKDVDVQQTYAAIKKAGMEKQVLVYINDEVSYGPWRKVAPNMPLMARIPDEQLTEVALPAFKKEFSFQAVDNKIKNKEQLALINAAGIAVFLDAQRKDEGPATWSPLLELGVQGLQTDHLEDLITYLKEKNLRNGASVKPVKKGKL